MPRSNLIRGRIAVTWSLVKATKYSLSSMLTDWTDSFHSHLPFVSISHQSGRVFQMASTVSTKLLNLSFCWSANSGMFISMRVHRKTLFIRSFLLSQPYPGSLTWMDCEMGGTWPYNCCYVECCFQGLFKTVRSNLELFSSSLFFNCFVKVHVVQPYRSSGRSTSWLLKWNFIE